MNSDMMLKIAVRVLIALSTTLLAQVCFSCDEFRILHEDSGKYVKLYAFIDRHSNIRINVVLEKSLDQEGGVEMVISEGSYVYREPQNITLGNYTFELNYTREPYSKRILQFLLPQLNITRELHLDCPGVCCIICSSMVVDVTNVTKLGENEYLLSVSTNASSDLEIMTVKYTDVTIGLSHNVSNGTVDKNGIQFTMDKVQDGGRYEITVIYYDADNVYCKNSTVTSLEVPVRIEPITHVKVIMVVVLLMLVGVTMVLILKYARQIAAIILKAKHGHFQSNDVPPFLSHGKEVESVIYKPILPPRQVPPDQYEFPREKIQHVRVLDQGEFGIVYESKAWGLHGRRGYTMVAVKVLKDCIPDSEIAMFRHEINLQKIIGNHKNVIRMLGCVELTQPMMIILELVPTGNLKHYFKKLRDVWSGTDRRRFFGETSADGEYIQPECGQIGDYTKRLCENLQNIVEKSERAEYLPKQLFYDEVLETDDDTDKSDDLIHCDSTETTPLFDKEPEPALDHKELEDFAYQIACGMSHLESKGIVHRDLAARNILITHNKILKVSDFGMSKQGIYVSHSLKKIPLRWKALEFLEQFKDDSKSDVWAYGVVLWEIGTLGAFPYEEISNDNILHYLQSGQRLSKPITCTDDHYQVMLSCWEREPYKRPTFSELKKHFASKKNHAYVDFRGISPNYVFPPMCDEDDGMDIKDISGIQEILNDGANSEVT
ncbi:unnamed protein product [Callosobruchus maculatus]|uniref:Protein kinase domain-containing protein n=2 Tax=Callosobruchus maculatus TaxID=64391 RepID=A0A653D3T5_CALMS|nr:unnamed protein product [Callosobruchus maculatus]